MWLICGRFCGWHLRGQALCTKGFSGLKSGLKSGLPVGGTSGVRPCVARAEGGLMTPSECLPIWPLKNAFFIKHIEKFSRNTVI